ncbi:hypothetical protein EWM64_g5881 [Hericium alpestre]|uniref:PWI domain-containing protein n=1 Tax=Hericium alpestre TaxID=135208 RepID=A0A4Y9ZTK4_9AGAM|nr:hypothetical protein EWM64_g5881 [Hericium alpestre]
MMRSSSSILPRYLVICRLMSGSSLRSIVFVLEHLKDYKAPQTLVEGLELVLEEEAVEFVISIWRQIIFESTAYGEGLHTKIMLDD